MFDGFHFDQENPYTYREGKRLIKLLGDRLQNHRKLAKLGVDSKSKRRGQITGRRGDGVWDLIPLQWPGKTKEQTSAPHFGISIRRSAVTSALTIPNGLKGGGIKTKLKKLGFDEFQATVLKIEKSLRPICKKSKNVRPTLLLVQRHYKSQSSPAIVDARMEFDLRTLAAGKSFPQKYQPQWLEAMYQVLTNKKSNMQLSLEVFFDYSCPIIRSSKAVELFAETMVAIHPLTKIVKSE